MNIYITENNFYYLILHLKLSSLFYSTQLIEIFAYEIPTNKNVIAGNKKNIPHQNNFVLVYNFHSIISQQRFFIFFKNSYSKNIKKNKINWNSLISISELFLNANWLEREAGELHGVFFSGKKDIRNLMLQYGDTSAPMKKSYPSIGTKEIFYDSVTDNLIQNPVSVQF